MVMLTGITAGLCYICIIATFRLLEHHVWHFFQESFKLEEN